MGRDRFVQPDIVRLTLSDGDYIDIKRRLNTGEQHTVFERMAPEMNAGEKTHLRTRAVMTSKVLEYLLGWSFMRDGHPVPYSPDLPETDRLATLNALDPDSFREIKDAIEAHEAEIEQETTERKNDQAGVSESRAPLLSAVR